MKQLNKPVADGPTREELFDLMKNQASDEMDFVMNRAPQDGKTFSAEGITEFADKLKLFIGARLMAHWQKQGAPDNAPGPTQLRVHMSVEIDGEVWRVGDELRPWYVLDGGLRQ